MHGRKVIENIIQKAPIETPDPNEPRKAFDGERQPRIQPAMLTIFLKNDDARLLAYPLLRQAYIRRGGFEWELVFDDCRVLFTGRNLGHKFRELLRMHRLNYLQEGNLIEDELTPEDKAFIESIQITDKEDV